MESVSAQTEQLAGVADIADMTVTEGMPGQVDMAGLDVLSKSMSLVVEED